MNYRFFISRYSLKTSSPSVDRKFVLMNGKPMENPSENTVTFHSTCAEIIEGNSRIIKMVVDAEE